MKAFLNLEFNDGGELVRFMERYLGERAQPHVIIPGAYNTTPIDAEILGAAAAQETTGAEQNQNAPRPRKPRSDAGQPRGPHKTTGDTPTPVPASVVAAAATAVSPTQSTPPAPTTPPAAPPSAAAPLAPAGAGKLTEAHARAELKKISTEPGMGGTQAAIDYIKKFGVHQITKLPESMYEQFIAGVDKEIAAFRAKPKALAK